MGSGRPKDPLWVSPPPHLRRPFYLSPHVCSFPVSLLYTRPFFSKIRETSPPVIWSSSPFSPPGLAGTSPSSQAPLQSPLQTWVQSHGFGRLCPRPPEDPCWESKRIGPGSVFSNHHPSYGLRSDSGKVSAAPSTRAAWFSSTHVGRTFYRLSISSSSLSACLSGRFLSCPSRPHFGVISLTSTSAHPPAFSNSFSAFVERVVSTHPSIISIRGGLRVA